MKKNNLGLALKIFYPALRLGVIMLSAISLTSAQNIIQKKEKFDWEKIIPLVTKRAEIEEFYGKPFTENGYVSFYRTGFGSILVMYYGSKDLEKASFTCSVSLDTVSSYNISLSKRIFVSNLGWKLNRFENKAGDDGRLIYYNEEKGISFVVEVAEDGKEEVVAISYEPPIEDKKNKCVEKPSSAKTSNNFQFSQN